MKFITLFITALLVIQPASLYADKDKAGTGLAKKATAENDKKPEPKRSDKEEGKEKDKKKGKSVKKKAVKKAGTAAAAGVATKKVTDAIKK